MAGQYAQNSIADIIQTRAKKNKVTVVEEQCKHQSQIRSSSKRRGIQVVIMMQGRRSRA